MSKGQAGVVNAEKTQECCLQIVYVYRIFGYVISQVIGFTDCLAAANAATGQPAGKCVWVMVAAPISSQGRVALCHWGPAELAAPQHDRIFQQATLFEILDQSSCWLVCDGAGVAVATNYV